MFKPDFDKYYDIKTLKGQEFEGCRVYKQTDHDRSMGDPSTTITPFFEANGLESKLQSGFLMRVNKKVTEKKIAEEKAKAKKEMLKILYETQQKLNENIKGIEEGEIEPKDIRWPYHNIRWSYH